MHNAAQSRAWEQNAIQNTSLKTDVPASVASELIRLHFTWISPMFLFVSLAFLLSSIKSNVLLIIIGLSHGFYP